MGTAFQHLAAHLRIDGHLRESHPWHVWRRIALVGSFVGSVGTWLGT
jgi:hypothetical protein